MPVRFASRRIQTLATAVGALRSAVELSTRLPAFRLRAVSVSSGGGTVDNASGTTTSLTGTIGGAAGNTLTKTGSGTLVLNQTTPRSGLSKRLARQHHGQRRHA